MIKSDSHRLVRNTKVRLRNSGKDSVVRVFDSDGKLIRIENRNGKVRTARMGYRKEGGIIPPSLLYEQVLTIGVDQRRSNARTRMS